MELLFVLIVLGGGAYWFFRGNIRRGGEVMRAHIFLSMLERNKSVVEANGFASVDMTDAPPGVVHGATARADHEFGGLKMAMVGAAYSIGLQPKLSAWERTSADAVFQNWLKSQPQSFASPDVPSQTPSVSFPDYASYYAAYIAELKRLSGMQPDQHHQAELMEEIGEATGDNLTRQNFERGVDPKEYAAAVHTATLRMPPDEVSN